MGNLSLLSLTLLIYIPAGVKFGRSGSRVRVQSGGRRPSCEARRPWRPLPAPQLLAGVQGERNPREGVRDSQGAAGRRKEGAVKCRLSTRSDAQNLAWREQKKNQQPICWRMHPFLLTSQELKLKDKECERLSQVRNQLEQELEELTASLFEVSRQLSAWSKREKRGKKSLSV